MIFHYWSEDIACVVSDSINSNTSTCMWEQHITHGLTTNDNNQTTTCINNLLLVAEHTVRQFTSILCRNW